MEPEPIITHAFSLVAQEVEQRASIVVSTLTTVAALLAKNDQSNSNSSSSGSQSQTNKKKEWP